MNKSEIAETKLPCGCVCDQNDPKGPIFWNPFNKCVQCHKCGQSYFVERAIAESQAPQPPYWEYPQVVELGDGEPSPEPRETDGHAEGDTRELKAALRKLANEAKGFLSMAVREAHGNTNMRIFAERIVEAEKLLG